MEGRSRSWVFCWCVWFGVCENLGQKGPSHSPLPSPEVLVKKPGEGVRWVWRIAEPVGRTLSPAEKLLEIRLQSSGEVRSKELQMLCKRGWADPGGNVKTQKVF